MKRRKYKKIAAAVLSMALLLQPVTAAEGTETGTGTETGPTAHGLCTHHTEHTADCGYQEAVEGQDCNHTHTDDCYQIVEKCTHEHDASCYPEGNTEGEPSLCTHKCSEESGCVKKELDCRHQHDDSCGYIEATEGSPCTFVCTECGSTGETQEPGGDTSQEEDGRQGITDRTEAVEKVQALIDALPVVTDTETEIGTMSEEDKAALKEQLAEAKTAYDALTDEEKEQITEADKDKLEKLLELIEGAENQTSDETVSEAVKKVQELIEALPTVDEVKEMNTEEKNAAYTKTQEAYAAYEKLTEEEQALVDITKIEALFTYFNSMTAMTESETVTYQTCTVNSDYSLTWSEETVSEYSVVTSSDSRSDITWNGGWYVVDSNVNITHANIIVNGNVSLILADDQKLTIGNQIVLREGNSLTIYGQEKNNGAVVVEANSYAGIGGDNSNKNAGDLTVYGGNVTATGSYGAGIGGAETDAYEVGGKGGNVTVYGGSVRATGNRGAGIGGSSSGDCDGGAGGNVKVYGGSVTAIGSYGAGIGGGQSNTGGNGGAGGNVTVYGGSVTATGSYGAGIGGGQSMYDNGGAGGNVTVYGGSVTATGSYGAGIGGGRSVYDGNGGAGGSLTIYAGTLDATGKYGKHIGGGQNESNSNSYGQDTVLSYKGGIIKQGGSVTHSKYSVTVTPGNYMSITNGAASTQTVTVTPDSKGEISQIAITALDGYFFPSNYSVSNSCGLTITRTSDTTLSISGTPNVSYTDCSFTLPDATQRTYTLAVTAPTFTGENYGYTRPVAQPVTITSSGNSAATIMGVALGGTNPNAFTLNKTDGSTISAGATDNTTYTIQPKEGLSVGSYSATITVTYQNGSGTTATATANVSFTVAQADQTAPATAPTIKSHTENSITLNTVTANTNGAAAQYSKDGGTNWQDSPEFGGLTNDTTTAYTFVVCYKEVTGKYNASPASSALSQTGIPHDMGDYSSNNDATCTADGTKTKRCGCGYTETVPDTGSKKEHTMTPHEAVAATCMEKGIKAYWYCSECKKNYDSATGGNVIADTATAVNPDNHKPASAWTQENGKHYHVCENGCGAHLDEAACSGGTPTYTKKAVCAVCGKPYGSVLPTPAPSPTPSTPKDDEPNIAGEDGKKGWGNIVEQITELLKEQADKPGSKGTVTVDMNGTTKVPQKVIASIAGKDIDIVFDMGNGMTWTVNGTSVTNSSMGTIDFGVQTGTHTIPVDVINKVTGEKYSLNLSLAHNGAFGFTAVLTLNMEQKNAGLYANLFYYNPQAGSTGTAAEADNAIKTGAATEDAQPQGALEFLCADQIDKKGNASLTFTHASDYTIVIDTVSYEKEDTSGDDSGRRRVSAQRLRAAAGKNAVRLVWSRVKGADGYLIYGALCGSSKKLIKTVKDGAANTYTRKGLQSAKGYQFVVRAYKLVDGKKVTVGKSWTVYVTTKGGAYKNPAVVTCRTAVTLEKGNTAVLKSRQTPARPVKRYAAKFRYLSSDRTVASVDKNGRITGKKAGTCTVYVYAQNGQYVRVRVTVK